MTTFTNKPPLEENLAQTQILRIRQADRLPTLVVQLVDDMGDPIDLIGHSAWLAVRKEQSANGGGSWSEPRQTVIIDYSQGIMSYDWQEVDTATSDPGIYELSVTIRSDETDESVVTAPTHRDTYVSIRSSVVPDQGVVLMGSFSGAEFSSAFDIQNEDSP